MTAICPNLGTINNMYVYITYSHSSNIVFKNLYKHKLALYNKTFY